jgi:hypothetical protein
LSNNNLNSIGIASSSRVGGRCLGRAWGRGHTASAGIALLSRVGVGRHRAGSAASTCTRRGVCCIVVASRGGVRRASSSRAEVGLGKHRGGGRGGEARARVTGAGAWIRWCGWGTEATSVDDDGADGERRRPTWTAMVLMGNGGGGADNERRQRKGGDETLLA